MESSEVQYLEKVMEKLKQHSKLCQDMPFSLCKTLQKTPVSELLKTAVTLELTSVILCDHVWFLGVSECVCGGQNC